MKHFVTALAMIVAIPFAAMSSAQAFQILSADQLANGIGVRGGVGFKDVLMEEQSPFQVEFSSSNRSFDTSRSSNYTNWYGREDGGGRYYGDRQDSNHQNCSGYSDSNASMLYSMNGGGHSYPCQRFR